MEDRPDKGTQKRKFMEEITKRWQDACAMEEPKYRLMDFCTGHDVAKVAMYR